MPEQWKRIPGFPGYDVSDQGNVRSYYTRKSPRGLAETPQEFLRPSIDNRGYLYVSLRNNGKSKRCPVARLVLLAFVGPLPEGMESCHNDSIKWNNTLKNLRYDTHKGNMADMRRAPNVRKLSPLQKRLRARWKDIEFDLTHLFMEFVTEDWIGSYDNA